MASKISKKRLLFQKKIDVNRIIGAKICSIQKNTVILHQYFKTKILENEELVSSVLVALTMLLVLGSCGSTKNVAYFQNADSISLAASRMLYEAKIIA